MLIGNGVAVSGVCNYVAASAFEVSLCSGCKCSEITGVIVFCYSVDFYADSTHQGFSIVSCLNKQDNCLNIILGVM